jgi:hypothetical protein
MQWLLGSIPPLTAEGLSGDDRVLGKIMGDLVIQGLETFGSVCESSLVSVENISGEFQASDGVCD